MLVLGSSTTDAIYQQSQMEKGNTIEDIKGIVWFVKCKEAGKIGVASLMNQCRGYEVVINVIGIFIITPLIGYITWPYF